MKGKHVFPNFSLIQKCWTYFRNELYKYLIKFSSKVYCTYKVSLRLTYQLSNHLKINLKLFNGN